MRRDEAAAADRVGLAIGVGHGVSSETGRDSVGRQMLLRKVSLALGASPKREQDGEKGEGGEHERDFWERVHSERAPRECTQAK